MKKKQNEIIHVLTNQLSLSLCEVAESAECHVTQFRPVRRARRSRDTAVYRPITVTASMAT